MSNLLISQSVAGSQPVWNRVRKTALSHFPENHKRRLVFLALSHVFTVLETGTDFLCLYPPLTPLKTTYCFSIFPDIRIKVFKDFS